MNHKITPKQRQRIALATGVNDAYLYQCLTGRKNMNPAEAVRVEHETFGAISRFDLCQQTGRAIWPELAPKLEPAQQP